LAPARQFANVPEAGTAAGAARLPRRGRGSSLPLVPAKLLIAVAAENAVCS